MTATMTPVNQQPTEMMFEMIQPRHHHKPVNISQIVTKGLHKTFKQDKHDKHRQALANVTELVTLPTPTDLTQQFDDVDRAATNQRRVVILPWHPQATTGENHHEKQELNIQDFEADRLLAEQLTQEEQDNLAVPVPVPQEPAWQAVPVTATNKTKFTRNMIPRTLDINKYHQILGHVNERYLRQTAAYHGIRLTGFLKECVDCALAKMHANPISKETNERCKTPGERIYVDISHFPQPSIARSKYWLLILDDASDMIFSIFLKQKSESPEHILAFINKMKDRGTPVKTIRLDNAGENVNLQNQTTHLNIQYEFTAPNTPQQNGRVERKFAVLYECVRSLLNTAKLPDGLRQKCWAEAANHATDLLNGTCTKLNPVPPYKRFYGTDPPYYKFLQSFGEITVTSTLVNKKVTAKTANRGTLAIYLGRAQNHSPDSYRLLKLDTQQVIISRNVGFTRQMYDEYYRHDNNTPSNRYEALSDHEDDHEHDVFEIDTSIFVPGTSSDTAPPPIATVTDNSNTNTNRYATRSTQQQQRVPYARPKNP
jgi:hypothetical protein